MLLSELTKLELIQLLQLVSANDGPVKRKTQMDLRAFIQGLNGEPITAHSGWEPFDNSAYDELLPGFMANLLKEAKRRFLIEFPQFTPAKEA